MPAARRFLIFAVIFSLVAGLVSSNPIYSRLFFRLFYLCAGLIVVSWLISKWVLRGIQFKRSSRMLRSQVGQIFEEKFDVINPGRLPRLWIEIRDEGNLPGSYSSHVLTMVGGGETHTYISRTRLMLRGVFSLGPTRLISGDPFGLFPVNRTFQGENSLLVYPMLLEIHSFPNPPGMLPGGEALRRRTLQITSNAAGVREYAPGDPLNRIHWLSTARRNRLMVKEFELDPLAEVWIFVDSSRDVQVDQPRPAVQFEPQEVWRKKYQFKLPPSTIEYAVTIAASLSRYYIQRGRAVGLVSTGHSLRVLPSDRGGRQLGKILEALALLQPEVDLPLHAMVEAQARYLPRGSTVVVITPSGSDGVYLTADILRRRGLRPVIVMVDAASFGKPDVSQERLLSTLTALHFTCCQVKDGDDLTEVLSNTLSRTYWT
jgi:uncharacterized protein (DUF58 family)